MSGLLAGVSPRAQRWLLDGGPGSGNFGHKGRPGLRGGSGKGGGKMFRSGNASSGYTSFKHHAEFNGIADKVAHSKTAAGWVKSMSDSERSALKTQYSECGTKETEQQYYKRMFEMLRGKPEEKGTLPDNWRESDTLDRLDKSLLDQYFTDTDDISSLVDNLSPSSWHSKTLIKISDLCGWKDRMIDRSFDGLSEDESEDMNFLLDQFPWNDAPQYAHIPNEETLSDSVNGEVRKYYSALKFKALGFDISIPPKPEGLVYAREHGTVSERLQKLDGGVVYTPAGDKSRSNIKKMMTDDANVAKRAFNGCPDDLKQRIIASVDGMDDRVAELVEKTLPHCDVRFFPGDGQTCYTRGNNSIHIFTGPYTDGTRPDFESSYWHEYGHYLDANSKLTGMTYIANPLSYPIEGGGALDIARTKHASSQAAGRDVEAILDKIGLADRYGVSFGQAGFYIYRKSDNKEISVFVDSDEDVNTCRHEIADAMFNAIHEWSGYNEASEYLYASGKPREVAWGDYFETYVTPKRQLVRTRGKFKGAEEAYQKAAIEYHKKQDEWEKQMGDDGLQELFKRQRELLDEAEKKELAINGVTDSIDESVCGLFMMCALFGGHRPDYYKQHTPGTETSANVFAALALRNDAEMDFMRSFMPNTTEHFIRSWRFSGP